LNVIIFAVAHYFAISLPSLSLSLCFFPFAKIQREAEDLDRREMMLMAKEAQQVQEELEGAKTEIVTVINKFEKQLKNLGRNQLNSLIKESETAIASIVKAHNPAVGFPISGADRTASYTPQFGEQVRVKGLGGKLAKVVESPGDDETILVQYGKVKVRVKKNSIRAIPPSSKNPATSFANDQGRQVCIKKSLLLYKYSDSVDIINLSGKRTKCTFTLRKLFCKQ
jgi:DNA mismatch repair protein MutS2